MADAAPFSGFPQEGLDFLRALTTHNDRAWFNARKQTFQQQLEAPAVALVVALGARLRDAVSPDIVADTRTNGAGSLMRITRDTRFSPDKTPYKSHLDMWLWEGSAPKKMHNPGFGLRIGVEDGALYAGLLVGLTGLDGPVLDRFRAAVAGEKLGPALVEAIAAVTTRPGYHVEGEHLKRIPAGYPADHPRADLLRYNGLHAYSPPIDPALLTSAAFVDAVVDHCCHMAPVHQWLVRMLA
ncbi:MAG: DUF2461 domain-containing protein [Anaerolineae bacterium]|nr:DUF2461 domain-containing protein [Anaerolineae bacterium]